MRRARGVAVQRACVWWRPRFGGALAAAILAVIALLGFAGNAAAAAPVPFNPAQPTVFVAQGGPTQLEAAQQVNGSIVFANVGKPTANVTYNAIAYDTCDNFIYGVQSTTANGGTPGQIIKIASDGSITNTSINVGSGFNVGAFGPGANCSQLYVGQSGTNSLDLVNLSTGTFSTIGVGSKGPDMTYNGGYFWSMATANQIQRISVTPGQLGTTLFPVSTPAINGGKPPGGTFGAAWTYGNGNVGFSDNTTGNIYQLSIANPDAPLPTFTTVLSQAGPSSGNNDGTNAPGLSTDLALTKTASPVMADPGTQITYTLTVTNNGPGNSSGYALNDSIPAGLTNVATTAPGCQITSQTVSCAGNPLAPGASETRMITGNAPTPGTAFTSPLNNSATVTANENDPNQSNNTATAVVNPNIVTVSLTKTAAVTPAVDQNGANVGDTIQYSYNVTNTGNVPLVSVAVSDPTAGAVTCPVPASPGLAPSAAETCVADAPYTVAQTDVDAGSVKDSATATGTDATNFTSPKAGATATVQTVAAAPSLSMRKIAVASLGNTTPIAVGETVQYSYVLTNTGNVDLSSLGVSDPTAGAVTCPAPGGAGLGPGQSETCTANSLYTITQADVDNGSVTDTATGSGTDQKGQTVTSKASNTLYPVPAAPEVSVNKTAVVSPGADQNAAQVGDTIQYSYNVTNIGNVTLQSVAVSDPPMDPAGAVSCPIPASPGLAPGDSETCTANNPYTVTQSDVDTGSVTDTATATGTDTQGDKSPPSDPATVTVSAISAAPSVSIVKSAAVSPGADQNGVRVGDTIQYSYTVTNTGNVTLQSVGVSDPTNGTVSCPTPAGAGLAPGASEQCTADNAYTVAQSDVDAGSVSDSATATGIDTQGLQSPSSAPASNTVKAVAPAPAVSIQKTATVNPASDQDAVSVGDRIQYSYAVTNTGNVTLASVDVNDPATGKPGVDCPTPAAPGLAPGASETCAAAQPHVVTQADVDAGKVTDTATATGTDTQGTTSAPSAPDSATVNAALAQPAVSLIKTANAADGNQTALTAGELIHYSYLVTNTGNVDLKTVAVSDNLVASVTCPTPAGLGLAPGQSETCTGVYTVTVADAKNNSVTNLATATGTGPGGNVSPPSSGSSVTEPSGTPAPEVAISKQAVVAPASDQNGVQVGDHISYSYKVTNVGNVNLSSVAVDDPGAGNIACPAIGAGGLAPGASVTCTEDDPYQVTQADLDAGSVLDTATATGSATVNGVTYPSPESPPSSVVIPAATSPKVLLRKSAVVSPPADQNSGVNVGDTIQYSYNVTNTGNVTLKSVSVSDPSLGTVNCPTPTPPGLAPGAAETCTAASSVTVKQSDVDAGSISDSATATGTDVRGLVSPQNSDAVTVQAVTPDPTVSVAKHATVTPSGDKADLHVGDTIDYAYTVTNTGNVTLPTITLTDPELGAVSCPAPAAPGLAPNASETCNADNPYTVTQADIDNGGVTDTATVGAADTNGNLTPTATDSITVPATRSPGVSLKKIATVTPTADQNGAKPGDSIAYTFRVTNTGNVDLASISVSDPTLGPVACPMPAGAGLAPGASETCTGEVPHIVTDADRTRGVITDTATATGTDGAGQASPPASASVTVKVPGGTAPPKPPPPKPPPPKPTPPKPAPPKPTPPKPTPPVHPKPPVPATELIVHKHVDHASAYPGQKLTYTLTVHNNGPDRATDVTVTDAPSQPLKVSSIRAGDHRCRTAGMVTCSLGTIAAGKTDTVRIVAVAIRTGTERNTATARSKTRLLHPGRARSTVTTRISPILRLRKRARQSSARTGQNVTYRITVNNPTTVSIAHVGVCDALPTGLGFLHATPHASLRTGSPCWRIPRLAAHRSRTLTVVVNVEPGTNGRVRNTAKARARGVRPVTASAHIRVTATPKSPCTLPSATAGFEHAQSSGRGPVARPAC